MNIYLRQFVDYLLNQSWQIAILAMVVALLVFLLRNKSAHVRYLLWLIVLAKCLVPPLYGVPLRVLPEDTMGVRLLGVQSPGVPSAPENARSGDLSLQPLNAAEPPKSSFVIPEPAVAEQRQISRIQTLTWAETYYWLGFIWLVGACVYLAFNALRALRTNHWLRRARRPLPIQSLAEITKFFSAHGSKSLPAIWLAEDVSQPFVWGLVRGSIYLPADFHDTNNLAQQHNTLGHEISHIVRFDAAVNLLQVLSQAIFWFHPVVWWANIKMRREREKCCDEMAVARMAAQPKDYSMAVLEALVTPHESVRPVPSLAIAGSARNLEERIRDIMRPGKRFYRCPSLSTVTVLLLLALLTVPTAFILTAEATTEQQSRGSGKLAYIDHLSSDENLARPTSIALSPDGQHLYVTAYGARCMAILRRDQLTGYIKRLDSIPLKGAFAARVSPNGRYVICSDVKSGPDYYSGTNTVTLFERDQSTGELALLDSVRNEENGIDSLDNVVDICFSPNSEFVYVIGCRSAAVAAFRITVSKKLALVQSNKGQDRCFNGARGIAISPDGKYVYVTSVDAGTLVVLQRNTETGKISLKQVFKDEQGDVHGLGGVWDVTCSPDGRFIYTNAGRQQGEGHDDAVCTFERTGDGTLSLVQELRTNEAQIGLAGGSRLRVSPDGKHLYTLGCNSDSMASFQRHSNTGKLTYLQTMSFRRLNNKYCYPGDLAISPDGAYVYVAGEGIGINGIILLKLLPWTKNSTAQTLYEAACSGDRSLLESAIKKGAGINAMGQGGYTALHWAAQKNQKQAATLLLDAGADVNARTGENGWTPLHVAAMQSNKDVSKILVDRGADLDAKNNNNRKTPLVVAQLNGDIDFAAFLLDAGAKLDSTHRGGQTPLHQAATQGDIAFAELLIKKGADVAAKDRPGWTPLFCATRWHRMQMIEWLISKGADVNAKSRAGQTPLHMACGIGMLDIVELLLAHGADIQARTNKGDTPLSVARKNSDVVELLRKHGAKE